MWMKIITIASIWVVMLFVMLIFNYGAHLNDTD